MHAWADGTVYRGTRLDFLAGVVNPAGDRRVAVVAEGESLAIGTDPPGHFGIRLNGVPLPLATAAPDRRVSKVSSLGRGRPARRSRLRNGIRAARRGPVPRTGRGTPGRLVNIPPDLQQRTQRDRHAQDECGNGDTRLAKVPGDCPQQGITAPVLQEGIVLRHSMAFTKLSKPAAATSFARSDLARFFTT